jgi:hypothetical protein
MFVPICGLLAQRLKSLGNYWPPVRPSAALLPNSTGC